MRLLLRSAFVILILLLVDIFFIACRNPKEYNYKYTKAQFQLSEFDASGNTASRYLNSDGDSTTLDKLQMHVYLTPERIAFSAPAPGLFFNTSYAYTYYDHYKNTSRLKRVDLKTLNDFNKRYTAGSDIQNAVVLGIGSTYASADSARGAAFIALYNNYPAFKDTYDEYAPQGVFWIKFTEQPTPNALQQIAMEIELEDGTILRDTTIQFIVK